jgi:hypothetical protein
MAFAKPRGVSKTLYGQRRLRIGETMGGGGGARIKKLFGTKGSQTKADNQTKGKWAYKGKYYIGPQPKRPRSFTEDMFKSATTPRRKP